MPPITTSGPDGRATQSMTWRSETARESHVGRHYAIGSVYATKCGKASRSHSIFTKLFPRPQYQLGCHTETKQHATHLTYVVKLGSWPEDSLPVRGYFPSLLSRRVKALPQKAENVGRIMRKTCARPHPRLDRTCERIDSST
ncbi:hypothetical protein F511_04179 [Dorcoceras hygrometricum]|uniref:Uncharacterized protein n=1 Tax=Dorcoceras hygrometricum TaxID=472368 RepID=A0A2Z7BHT0_9LAMI|nr:hypothetical protein F511_04179 [Dorcoceras hygrometricum]